MPIVECPKCRQIHSVQKVSAIVHAGLTVSDSQSFAHLKVEEHSIDLPTVKIENTSGTLLAKKLMMLPEEKLREITVKRYPNPDRKSELSIPKPRWVKFIYIGFALLGIIAIIVGIILANYILPCGALIVIPIIWIYTFSSIESHYEKKHPVLISRNREIREYNEYSTKKTSSLREQLFQKIKARWSKLYYCSRDDIVFIPESDQLDSYASLDDMWTFLSK